MEAPATGQLVQDGGEGKETSRPKPNRQPWRTRVGQYAPTLVLIGLFLLLSLFNANFLSFRNLNAIAELAAPLFIVAAGLTFVIMLGSIDLSVESMASLVGLAATMAFATVGSWGIILTLILSALAGALNGWVHTYFRIPSFVATLGALGLWSGVAFVISDARAYAIPAAHAESVAWMVRNTLGINNSALLALGVLGLLLAVQLFTPLGRYVQAIGFGESAVWFSGVRVNRYKILAFIISALCAGLAGILLMGRVVGGSPSLAKGFLLPAVAAVALGGTAITGGSGGVGRTVIGALIVTVLRMGMDFIGIPGEAQQLVYGIVVIVAVTLTTDRGKLPMIK